MSAEVFLATYTGYRTTGGGKNGTKLDLLFEVNGVTKATFTTRELAEATGIAQNLICTRAGQGMSLADLLTVGKIVRKGHMSTDDVDAVFALARDKGFLSMRMLRESFDLTRTNWLTIMKKATRFGEFSEHNFKTPSHTVYLILNKVPTDMDSPLETDPVALAAAESYAAQLSNTDNSQHKNQDGSTPKKRGPKSSEEKDPNAKPWWQLMGAKNPPIRCDRPGSSHNAAWTWLKLGESA